VRWCDGVVGDYNHWYDGAALLHALTLAQPWRVALLVDEAHNLVDRARAMYSAALDAASLRRVRAVAPAALKRPLERLRRAWSGVAQGQSEAYRVLPEPPPKLASALQDFTAAATELFAEQPAGVDPALLEFYFDALRFVRLLESFGAHSLFDVSLAGEGRARGATLCVRNVVPAGFLAPRHAAARTTVLFSATLAPQHYYADTLGLPADTAWLDVEPPFAAEQLSVRVVREVSTRWQHRGRSLEPIAALMARQYAAAPGNYLAFFSSFDYLRQVAEVFAQRHGDVPTWEQTRRMDEAERTRFLERFAPDGRGIGFAVLGGAFAEGIDLPGTRLVGAFIATLGLPQFNPVNEEMRRRIDATFGAGYDYAYLYPGIRKVVQAAGRVVRTPTDRGVVHLIDDRYARPEVARLLPRWWGIGASSRGDVGKPAEENEATAS
jgi:DNA excision repair protein ERCC-2